MAKKSAALTRFWLFAYSEIRGTSSVAFSGVTTELHLDESAGEIKLAEFRDMNGGGGLPTVHNLEVPETAKQQLSSLVRDIDLFGRGGNAVVVGEEHRWFVLDRDPYAAVDLAARLKEYSHVLFEKTRPPTIVNCGEDLPGYDGQV